jgi:5-methylcytosine-specific restriction endonuclease McrA
MLMLCTWILRQLPRRLQPMKFLRWHRRRQDWLRLKARHLKKEPCCQACGRRGALDVHHIVPVHIAPALELSEHNLITLCASPCHLVFGHLMSYNCYNKDVRRMVAAYRAASAKKTCLERWRQ